MSAWIVDKRHITGLVEAALRTRIITRDQATATGQMLLDTNIESVAYRYPNDQPHELPGRVDAEYLEPYLYKHPLTPMTTIEAIKSLHCYEYQSCEHPGWDDSPAQQLCRRLQDTLIYEFSGYEDAPWGWEKD